MSKREIVPLVLGLACILGCVGSLAAQTNEEWNAYQDIQHAQTPEQRLQAAESFLRQYPESIYRVYAYPILVETAYVQGDHARVMEAIDTFLAIPREEVLKVYKMGNPAVEDSALDPSYYRMYTLYTFSVLQSFGQNGAEADKIAQKAAERAAKALEMQAALYAQAEAQATPGVSREQLEQVRKQEEGAFHNVLAFTAWRKKDYRTAAREYGELVKNAPTDPAIHYRLGLASLQKEPSDARAGFWYLARSIALGVPKSDEIKDFLVTRVAAYEQAVPDCIQAEVDGLIAHAKESSTPPADWLLVNGDRVNGVRDDMSLQRILDDLQGGGETAKLMYLASCGSEIGVGEDGQPDLYVKVLAVTAADDNLVTLRVAAGQEAADAGIANMEVTVASPEEATKLMEEDVVRVSGTISSYLSAPQFLLQLAQGRVNPEDIPKTR